MDDAGCSGIYSAFHFPNIRESAQQRRQSTLGFPSRIQRQIIEAFTAARQGNGVGLPLDVMSS